MKQEQKRFEQWMQKIQHDNKIMFIGALLPRAAMLYGEKIALIYEDQQITFNHLYQQSYAVEHSLRERGVVVGDRVLLMIGNSPEFYTVYCAIIQCGAIVVPVNTFLHEHEIAHIVDDAHPKLIVCDDESEKYFASVACTVLSVSQLVSNSDNCDRQKEYENLVALRNPDETAVLLYTSGTTGVPKGVMLTSNNIMTNLAQGLARFELNKVERIFGVLPLFHSFAQNVCVWIALFVGVTVILVQKIDRRNILQALENKPTIMIGVPALYGLFCLLRTANFNNVRYFVCGGDSLPDKIRAAFSQIYRRKICSGYGLTEASPFVTVDLDDEITPTGTIGTLLPAIECKIVDEQGKVVTLGQKGVMWLRGDNVMKGYYNAPQATQKVLQDGWLETGDIVYMRNDKKIVIAGREKDLIIHKGFNVYPAEIENVLLMHNNVIFTGVVGKDDDDVGQQVIAFVQLAQEQDHDELVKQLRLLCKKYLATYKMPKKFVCSTQSLPLTATRKVDKKKLRKKV
jgi:long-chain acyl-CoA synthetase